MAAAQQAPRYSLGIPSIDEIPIEAIPPAPAPAKREPPKPAPQPKSPEEAAAYDKLLMEQRPDERIKLVEDFLLAYPDSELKQYAYLAAAESYRRKNDLGRRLTYAELTLAENPENLQALLTLAQSLPESVSRDDPDFTDRIAEAEDYAREVIKIAAKARRPAGMPAAQWQATRAQAEAAARLALGLNAMMREDYTTAEQEYSSALKLIEVPDAITLYRLGLTYSLLKKYDESLVALQKAAAAGGVRAQTSSGATRDLVTEALAYVEKQRAEAAPSAEPAEENIPSAVDAPVAPGAAGQ